MHEQERGHRREQGHEQEGERTGRPAREHGQEPCPECGRQREGGAPCACGADGEEFSPLRVRPYVTVGEEDDGAEPEPTTYGGALPEATMRLPRVPGPGLPGAGEPDGEPRGGGRRKGVYVASGAAVVVVGAVAALLAGGAFSSDPATPGPAPGVAAAAEPSTARTGGAVPSPSASASLPPHDRRLPLRVGLVVAQRLGVRHDAEPRRLGLGVPGGERERGGVAAPDP
ncbi:hypothetical protein [Streptomyces sp. NPDC047046]|uniref:hypothetical protein n=1 Tax=Streptomyces sp. NPDC047046 TaxID=3155378 RepID=UPI0033F29F0D